MVHDVSQLEGNSMGGIQIRQPNLLRMEEKMAAKLGVKPDTSGLRPNFTLTPEKIN